MVVDTRAGSRVTGFYRGIVLKHLPHGKCKIFIPSVYSEEFLTQPDILPDAEQAAPLFGGTNTGNGVFSYPNISSIVWCFFANEDQNYPVYFASTLGGQNAFGQYETIMPSRYEEEKDLSTIISTDIKSEQHLITAGKTQVELFENGILSIQVSNPIRTEASVDYNNTYQLESQDDHVISRPICEQIQKNQLSNIDCKSVYDSNIKNGNIDTQTNYFNILTSTNSLSRVRTFLTQDNEHNFDFGSSNVTLDSSQNRDEYTNICYNNDKKTQHILRHALSSSGKMNEELNDSFTISQDGLTLNTKYKNTNTKANATSTIKVAADNETGVFIESENLSSNLKCLINISTSNGMIEIKTQDLKNKKHSYLYMDKAGTITLDSSEAIILKAPTVKITASSRIDTKTQYSKFQADTDIELNSNAIHLNSKAGKTTIVSNSQQTIV